MSSFLLFFFFIFFFFFQAEDGIRDLVRSRGLGDVYKRQPDGVAAPATLTISGPTVPTMTTTTDLYGLAVITLTAPAQRRICLLYTSDAADERSSVDLGGRRFIKKKHKRPNKQVPRRQ